MDASHLLGIDIATDANKKAYKIPEYITFSRASDLVFPPYEGKIKVVIEKEPEGSYILIGTVCIRDVVGGAKKEKEKSGKILLRRMKEAARRMKKEAAKYGADAIELITDEPERIGNYLSWCARAYRTQENEDDAQ